MHILNILGDKTPPCLTPRHKRTHGDPDLLIRRKNSHTKNEEEK